VRLEEELRTLGLVHAVVRRRVGRLVTPGVGRAKVRDAGGPDLLPFDRRDDDRIWR
jgi:hypothetical protein